MITTVNTIFTEVLQLIGVVPSIQSPNIADLNTLMISANFMLDQWSAKEIMCRATTQINFPLVLNQSAYTIGIGNSNNIKMTKPYRVTDGFIRYLQTSTDFPLDIIEKDIYDSFPDKWVQSCPDSVFYDPGVTQQTSQAGTIYFYHTPDAGPYVAYLETYGPFSEFVNLSDLVTFEPCYFEAIVYNLLLRVFYKFRNLKTPIPLEYKELAMQSYHTLEGLNHKRETMQFDLPGMKGYVYDVNTGPEEYQ